MSAESSIQELEEILIRRAAEAFLRAKEPEALAELKTVFDTALSFLRDPAPAWPEVRWVHGRLQADSPFGRMRPSSEVIWIATRLVRAVSRDRLEPDLLADFAAQLASIMGPPRRAADVAEVMSEEFRCELVELQEAVRQLAGRFPLYGLGDTQPPTEAPDLEIQIRIEIEDGEPALRYLLHSPSGRVGYSYREVRGPRIQRPIQDYQASLVRAVERLGVGHAADGTVVLKGEVEGDLVALGRDLYRELFPAEMRAAYRCFRKVVKSLLIVSEEPWIPWELLRPYDDGPPEVIDDDFFCVRFQLTRWLAGETVPAAAIEVERLACFEAGVTEGRKRLDYAETERRWLGDLARRHGIDDRSIPEAIYAEVIERLEAGGIDLLHFVGHGLFEPEEPDLSSFLLVGGRPLRPRDLQGRVQTQIKRRHPLVFLNACQVARQSFSLTRLGGWAPRWVRDCGCGTFVAPMWTVDDRLAHLFATTFYSRLESGDAFGQAARAARQAVRELDPANPTWLAFTVYAHPNGRLYLDRTAGGSGSAEQGLSGAPRRR